MAHARYGLLLSAVTAESLATLALVASFSSSELSIFLLAIVSYYLSLIIISVKNLGAYILVRKEDPVAVLVEDLVEVVSWVRLIVDHLCIVVGGVSTLTKRIILMVLVVVVVIYEQEDTNIA